MFMFDCSFLSVRSVSSVVNQFALVWYGSAAPNFSVVEFFLSDVALLEVEQQ
jgi:hypothetical protein